MEQLLDILQVIVNSAVGAMLATGVLGKIIPDEKVRGFVFGLGAGLSKWGSKTFNVATWNAVEKYIISTFNNINASFGEGLRSDNQEK